MRLHSNGRLLALPANIRLGWKSMTVSNTLTYYDTAKITAVKVLYYRPQSDKTVNVIQSRCKLERWALAFNSILV